MLTHLSIQGLAIVESVHIDFGRGFNVITGETGAGKSILIKALGLLHGSKASPDSVRKGHEQATVSGRFVVKANHPALNILTEWGVVCEEDAYGLVVILRRQITAKGRSQSWVNDIPITSTSLKRLSDQLIDVFGQHENHRLLDVSFHTRYLDQFLSDKKLAKDVELLWEDASKAINELKEFVEEVRGRGRDLDYLAFRLKELSTFQPSAADYEDVRRVTDSAKSSMALSTALQRANRALDDEDGSSVVQRLREVAKALMLPKVAHFDGMAEEALKIASLVDELSFNLVTLASQVEISEEDIDLAEARIAGYQDLFRKHGVQTPEELLTEWQNLSNQVSAIDNAAGHIKKLISELNHKTAALLKKSSILTSARRAAVERICESVERELTDLAMPAAKFSVLLEPVLKSIPSLDLDVFGGDVQASCREVLADWSSLSEHGAERAEFYLASNAGEPSLPLAKVASGGEISRIMLALKKALVVGADTCVLVFDEIDTGISGRIADVVGQKIAELSHLCQIICISHLPQVAAYAKAHYVVEKKVKDQRTESNIRALSASEHLDEMARLLSGNKVTLASRSHAESLVSEAQSKLKERPSETASNKAEKKKSPAAAAAQKRRNKK